ncbi:MAG: hypothetical protein V1494_06900 [Candidatus Diapherotrites archaeon]
MGKVGGAFLAGFSLAMLIIFLTFFIYLTPLSGTINSAYQANEQIYSISHSDWYTSATSFLQTVKGLNWVPVIGEAAGWGGSIGELWPWLKTARLL